MSCASIALDLWEMGPVAFAVGLAALPADGAASGAGRGPQSAGAEDLADVRRTLDGDEDAFRALVERYQGHVASMMWRFTRDPGEHGELVQDVFVEVFQGLDRFRADAPFEHWLSRIATRTGYRYWKQRRRAHVTVPIEEWHATAVARPEEMDPAEAAGLLHRLLAQLPPRDRLVLTLRYFDEMDVAAIARRTGWSETMVKVQTHRAKQKLRRLLEQLPEGETDA
jgi:RNA polymerase sigma-70 factor, ECF subfamily